MANLAQLQAQLAALQKQKEEHEREEREQERRERGQQVELEWQVDEVVAQEAKHVKKAVEEAEQRRKVEAKKRLAVEQRKHEEERKGASMAEKAKKTVSVVGKSRSKGKGKAREREASPMDLQSNLRAFGDGPTESDDAMLLAMEANRNQVETDWVRGHMGESSKRKSREISEDTESTGKIVCDR